MPNLLIDLSWESLYQYIQKNADGRTSDGAKYIQEILSIDGSRIYTLSVQMLTKQDLVVIYEEKIRSYGITTRNLFTFKKNNPRVTFTEYVEYDTLKEIGSVDLDISTFNKNTKIKLDTYYYRLVDIYGYVNESRNIKDGTFIREEELTDHFITALQKFADYLQGERIHMSLKDLGFIGL